MPKIETVEDLITELAEYPLNHKVRIWIKGDGVQLPIDAVELGIASTDTVFLEVELK